MLSFTAATLVGFILLMWGADRFVVGAASTARNLGVPPLLIGLTLVGMATSGPEIFVSVTASLAGDPALAAGNAIGSNIANIGLVLGMTALIMPISVRSVTLRRELPALLAVTLIMTMVFINLKVSRIEGLLLIGTLALVLYWLVVLGSRSGASDPIALDYATEIPKDLPMRRAMLWLAVGLVVLLSGSHLLVWGAQNLAIEFGVSELVIGLTVVAIGTSLPELATSVAAAMKGENELAIGNIIGSNLFNLLCVLAIPGLVAPGALENTVLIRDYPMMIGLTFLLFFLDLTPRRAHGSLQRWEGGLLLGLFVFYLIALGWTASA
jgi:cation:H+ antiporter